MIQDTTYSIGIDVGGTNTDAVIIEHPSKSIVSAIKTTTTKDFTTGILQAIHLLFKKCTLNESNITSIMLGTTAFINALIQNSPELSPVTVVRICGPAVQIFPPFFDFPAGLQERLKSDYYFLEGGYEYHGAPITEFRAEQVKDVANQIVKKSQGKLINIAMIGVFSPIASVEKQQEIQAMEIMEQVFKEMGITNYKFTLSYKIGGLGFMDRENACILNAALKPMAYNTISNFQKEISNLNLKNCHSIFLTQNDGTLITCEEALELPILTMNSGPTNSLRGACELTNIKDAIVADIGGTTTDVALLEKGFPKQTSTSVYIAGVRTNFRMPNVYSIGLGGGSLVQFENGECKVGPVSVGYKLTKEAQCFGGQIATTTDVAVGSESVSIEGSRSELVKLSKEQIELAQQEILKKLEIAIDHVKTSKDAMPLILVGGGSILIPKDAKIQGVSSIIIPEHFGVANAFGAAISQISATVISIQNVDKSKAIEIGEQMKQQAIEQVKKSGAIADSIDVTLDSQQVPYSPDTYKFITKAIGNLDMQSLIKSSEKYDSKIREIEIKSQDIDKFEMDLTQKLQQDAHLELFPLTPPEIKKINGIDNWIISEEDTEYIGLGAAILGTGGGGSVYQGKKELVNIIRSQNKKPRVIQLKDLGEDEFVLLAAYYGAPTSIYEKVSGYPMVVDAVKKMIPYAELLTKKKIGAIMCAEVGGLNSLIPLCVGGILDIPVLDLDLMGRAFPAVHMIIPSINGYSGLPYCMGDIQGRQILLTSIPGGTCSAAEDFLRKFAMDYGLDMSICGCPLDKSQLIKWSVQNTLSHVYHLGRDIVDARKRKLNPLQVIEQKENGKLIFVGKITFVFNGIEGGYNKGQILIEGLNQNKNQQLKVEFQNENLIAKLIMEDKQEKILAVVPDLICIVDTETYQPILTEEVRYGLRVSVLHLPANEHLTSQQALKVVGPRAFNYEMDYVKCLEYQAPRSVFK